MADYRHMVNHRLVEETAEIILNEYLQKTGGVLSAPIPIFEIGSALYGLQHRSQPSGVVSGAWIEEDGIVYTNAIEESNETWGKQRTRFTIAHEIAHNVLAHWDESSPGARILIGTNGKKKTPEQINSTIEYLADQIAASLLMPRKLIVIELAKLKRFNLGKMSDLAKVFYVSQAAIAVRILRLHEDGELIQAGISLNIFQELKDFTIAIRQNQDQWALFLKSKTISSQVGEEGIPGAIVPQTITQAVCDLLFKLGQVKVARGKGSEVETPKRPLVIEFAGTPNSGKDTQINILTHYLRDRMKMRVHVIGDGYKLSEIDTDDNTALDKARQALFRLLDQLINLHDKRPNFDVVLINKGIFDHLAFQRFHTRTGRQSEDEENLYTKLLLQKRWLEITDQVFLLTISPEESIAREQQEIVSAGARLAGEMKMDIVSSEAKITMNLLNLSTLNDCYSSVYTDFGKEFRNIRRLHILPEQTKEELAIQMAPDLSLSLLQQPTQPDSQNQPKSRKSSPKGKSSKDSKEIQPNLL